MKEDLFPEGITITDCTESAYISLHRMSYTQKGTPKNWDFIKVHDSVAAVLADMKRRELILVRQFRPPVFLREKTGITYELCAGITDKAISPEETMREEILEETGYSVRTEDIERVTSFFTAVSFAGSRQTLYYAEIDDSQRTGSGGGVGTEKLEVIRLPFNEIHSFMLDESKPKTPGLLFGLIWFIQNKVQL
ncbi:MAG: NUDIX domain-containing protein [Deferribacterales bacterium]